MRFGIFTACYGYERWLPEWEQSIARMNPSADEVVIVGDEAAQAAWSGFGRFILAPEFGEPFRQAAAYNRAVSEMSTDFVMHIGVDDLVIGGLIREIARKAPRADVIAFDARLERDGAPVRVRHNRPTLQRILRPTMGGQPLDSCAAYRRTFWEKAPYNEEILGGTDVALWIAFAHAGARFIWTGQVGLRYRLHEDSLWHRRSPENIAEVRRALNALRVPESRRITRPSDVRLSIAIMAHPKRAAFVEELTKQLQAPATIVWDQLDSRWDTGRRALLALDPQATHHMVIQDDAIPCRDLVEGVKRLIERNPHCPTSLYLGRQRPHSSYFTKLMDQVAAVDLRWIIGPELCWGVGLVFPAGMIRPMVEFCDRLNIPNYDTRLGKWLEAQNIPTWYPVPSLVDHRAADQSPSLIPNRTANNRVAYRFIGAKASALDVDWMNGRIGFARHGRRIVEQTCPICGAEGYACGSASTAVQAEPVTVGA